MLQTQLNGQGGLSYTTIAEHHDLVRRCESSSHCRVRREGSARRPDRAVWSCEPEMLSAGVVGGVVVVCCMWAGMVEERKRERVKLCEEQRCWATKQEVAAKEGFAVD